MDSPRSGRDEELISIKTEQVILTIKGPTCHPRLVGKTFGNDESAVTVSCWDNYDINVYNSDDPSKCCPLFFEQQNYELILQYQAGHNVEFWHDNLSIRESITETKLVGSSQRLKSGIINFRGNIGFSDLVINVDGKKYLTVTVEVFPVKLDYKKDYLAIMDDLTKEFYSLVFDFLRETYTGYTLGNCKPNSLVEFLEIIKLIFSNFIKAVDVITYQPHHVLQTNHEVVRLHKAKRIDNKSVRWLEKHSDIISLKDGQIRAERVLAAKKEIIYDTRENQLTKFILQSTAKRLNEFKRKYSQLDRVENRGADQKGVLDPINRMISGINNKLNSTFLKDVSAFKGQGQLSLVFSMAPGYRELYVLYMILQHGLDLGGDVFKMSLKDLADLYEYWCFVKLNSILGAQHKLTGKDKIAINKSGLFATLVKDKRKSAVKYETSGGDKITLAYNAEGRYPTGAQKPDNTLSLSKTTSDGVKKFMYVFDAKYKLDPKNAGPEEEDINTMHRYRDAIVSEHAHERPWERLMFGAYVLFPLSGTEEEVEKYKAHIFYRSIDKVNIGGLPFLPSCTKMVEDLLNELIGESAEDASLRPPVQVNSREAEIIAGIFKERQMNSKIDINSVSDNTVIEVTKSH